MPQAVDQRRTALEIEALASPAVRARGRSLQQSGRVAEMSEHAGPSASLVEGKVFDDGESYRVSLSIEARYAKTSCTCNGEQPCSHAVALARQWARAREGQPRGSQWRALIERIAPRKAYRVPMEGERAFIHWLSLSLDRGNFWTLSISWREHRPNARTLGRGRKLSPGEIFVNPPVSMTPLDRRVFDVIFGRNPERPISKAEVPIPNELVEPTLRALSQTLYVYWEGSGERAAFEPKPVLPHMEVRETQQGLFVDCSLAFPGGRPWDAPARIIGSRYPWAEYDGTLRRVIGAADGLSLSILLTEGTVVPQAEVPSFLTSGISALDGWGVEIDLLLESGRTFGISETPSPRLYLDEEEGVLKGSLSFFYGDCEVLADNPDPVILFGAGEVRPSLRRDLEAEFEAVKTLRALGFKLTEPGKFEIEGDKAFDFILTGIKTLPEGWEVFGKESLKTHRVRSSPVSLRVKISSGIDWLDLEATASVEGEEARFEEIMKALERHSRYVRLGDGSRAVLPEEWLTRLSAVGHLDLSGGKARIKNYQAQTAMDFASLAEDLQIENEEQWKKLAEGFFAGESDKTPLPRGLGCELRPYQVRGYRWLLFLESMDLGGVLADDMGLGKTVQALALLLHLRETGIKAPTLIVAPTSVVPNWEAEIRAHAPGLTYLRYHGAERAFLKDEILSSDIVITSYAVMRRDIEFLQSVEWNYVMLDEAQAIKNAATLTAKSARKLPARRRLSLTGTPLENNLGELWSQFCFLMPELLGSERHFTEHYLKPIAKGDESAAGALRSKIRPFILRRLKPEVAPELPEKIENLLYSEFTPAQAKLYRSLLLAGREKVFRAVEETGFSKARNCVLDVLLRLRQVCCHPAVIPGGVGAGVGSAKFDQFCDFVTEVVAEGHKILVYSQFVQVLKILRAWFEEAGISHLYLDGRTRDRETRVRRFQEDESVKAFLVSLKAGGTGLNLTGADYVILFDPWWNPAVEEQAADRAHRIGQTRTVFSYKMIAKNSVEEKIQELAGKKRKLTSEFVRPGDLTGPLIEESDLDDLFRIQD
ncbi:ATP-dependent helicase [bacterium]|nr:MAG: ATP-dependent helicase [bacterium]